MILRDWLDTWYSLYLDAPDTTLAPSTIGMYRRSIRAVPGWLGDIDLAVLSPLDVRRWLLDVYRQHPRAAQLDRVMIRRAIAVAGKMRMPVPILDDDTLPVMRHNPRRADVLDVPGVVAYVRVALASPVAPLLLLCLCGLRRGEALAVRVSDFSMDYSTVTVSRQRYRVGGIMTDRPLKSVSSMRVLALPPTLSQLIEAWGATGDDLLCDVSPERLTAEHNHVMQKSGIEQHVTLHGLRHTAAALAAQSMPIKLVQAALGHASYKITADLYADHLPSVSRAFVSLF